MEAAPASTPQLSVSTFRRVMSSNYLHFFALSALFLLPLSFSISLFPTLLNHLSQPTIQTKSYDININTKTIFLSSLFALFVVVFSLLTTSSITHSIFHGFYGRPVKLLSAIKSAFASFFPLLITVVFAQTVVFGIILTCGLFLFLTIKGMELVGNFEVEFPSPYSIGFCFVFLVVFVYLQVNWSLACVIVVVESKWGIEALKRSMLLIEGMRKYAFFLLLFFGLDIGMLIGGSSGVTFLTGAGDEWKRFSFFDQILTNSAFLTMMIFICVVSITFLYMRCKAVHGELNWENAQEFAGKYVSLPTADGNAPHDVVSVAYT